MSAAAAPPVGTCPNPFTLYDRAAQLTLLEELRPDLPPEELDQVIDRTLAAFDHNGDELLCVSIHRNSPVKKLQFVNFVDNVVRTR